MTFLYQQRTQPKLFQVSFDNFDSFGLKLVLHSADSFCPPFSLDFSSFNRVASYLMTVSLEI